ADGVDGLRLSSYTVKQLLQFSRRPAMKFLLRFRTILVGVAALFILVGAAVLFRPAEVYVRPVVATDPVAQDADDPAIWVHPSDPMRSLIFGTDKAPAPLGAVFVFGLDGKVRQKVPGLDRPNNIDVEYGFPLGG